MKKLIIVLLLGGCVLPVLAQEEEAGNALVKVAQMEQTVAKEISQQMRSLQQIRLLEQVEPIRLVPLEIAGEVASVPAAVALPPDTPREEKAVGSLLLSTYLLYQNEDAQLESYLTHLSKVGTSKFLYRGLHLSDLKEVSYILQHGLTLDKTGYNSIYMTANPAVARHYAKVERGIPVVVMMDRSALAGSLRWGNLSEPYAEKDVPAEAVLRVFVLLDINGTPGWYKTTLENERLVFKPVAAKLQTSETEK